MTDDTEPIEPSSPMGQPGQPEALAEPPNDERLAPPMPSNDTSDDAVATLSRRVNLLVGMLALVLIGACITIGVLIGRVADAESAADEAVALAAAPPAGSVVESDQTEIDALRTDLERVEAGAALYASQLDGFVEQIAELEPEVSAGVDEAVTGLREFGDSTIAFEVKIDEVIPVKTDVVIDRVIEVPIKTTIPIQESFDTTIRIDTPLGDIPLDVTVPVDVDVPVDLVVEIPINESIELDEEFPVQLDVPIAIEVRETELANLTDSLAAGLESLQDVLSGLG